MNIYQENLITLIKAGTSPFHVVREGKKGLKTMASPALSHGKNGLYKEAGNIIFPVMIPRL